MCGRIGRRTGSCPAYLSIVQICLSNRVYFASSRGVKGSLRSLHRQARIPVVDIRYLPVHGCDGMWAVADLRIPGTAMDRIIYISQQASTNES